MVRLSTSTGHGVELDSYAEVSASEVQEGDLLKVNCAPDAVVLDVQTTRIQVILDIRHANGEKSTLSPRPDEVVRVRRRQ